VDKRIEYSNDAHSDVTFSVLAFDGEQTKTRGLSVFCLQIMMNCRCQTGAIQ